MLLPWWIEEQGPYVQRLYAARFVGPFAVGDLKSQIVNFAAPMGGAVVGITGEAFAKGLDGFEVNITRQQGSNITTEFSPATMVLSTAERPYNLAAGPIVVDANAGYTVQIKITDTAGISGDVVIGFWLLERYVAQQKFART